MAALDVADPTHPKLRSRAVDQGPQADMLSDAPLDGEKRNDVRSDGGSEIKRWVSVNESEFGTRYNAVR